MSEMAIPHSYIDNKDTPKKTLKETVRNFGDSAKKLMKDIRNTFSAKDSNKQPIDASTNTATLDQDNQLSNAENKDIDQNSENLHPLEVQAAELQDKLEKSTIPEKNEFPASYQTWLNDIAEKYQEEYQRIYQYIVVNKGSLENWEIAKDTIGVLLETPNSLVFGMSAAYPKEYDILLLYQARRIFSLFHRKGENHPQFRWAQERLSKAIRSAQVALDVEEKNNKIASEIQSGEHFIAHGIANNAGIESAFKTGHLLSRQAQLDKNGKAVITTSGTGGYTITEYQDGVYEVLDNVTGKDVRERIEPWRISSRLESERYDIDFLADGIYYYPGRGGSITFVFSPADALNSMKFYQMDGVHAHSTNFQPDNHVGYEVSLSEQKHFIVASELAREKVYRLVEDATWIKDKKAYLENVLFIEREDYSVFVTDEERIALQQKVKEQSKKLFAAQSIDVVKHVMPTDIILPASTNRVNKNQVLYQYR